MMLTENNQPSEQPAVLSNPRSGKRVLVIAFNWPPDASIGSVRPVNIAMQLKRQGWEPVILTVKERHYESYDRSRILPEGEFVTIRTTCLPTFHAVYQALQFRVKQLVSALLLKRGSETAVFQANDASVKTAGDTQKGMLRRILLSAMHTPDEHLGWFPFAMFQAWKAIHKYNIACMVSTAPPFTGHLVALLCKVLFRIPWIADFRDPWTHADTRPPEITSALSMWLNSRLEWAVIDRTDRVVCVTPATTAKYRALYPHLPDQRWETITNGFSAHEFQSIKDTPDSDRFALSYMGTFAYGRTPELVFQAVRQLFDEGMVSQKEFVIKVFGDGRLDQERSVRSLIANYGLDEVVLLLGVVKRSDALRAMRQSHALLLLVNHQKNSVPAKTYEYLGAGRSILAVTEEDSATADLVRRVGGAVVRPDNIDEMKRVLYAWYVEYKRGSFKNAEVDVHYKKVAQEYEWGYLGRRYAKLISAIC